MLESKSAIKDCVLGLRSVRSRLVALATFLTLWAPVRVLYAQPTQGDHEGMMGHTNGWMGGGMWLWTVIGLLVVVLLVVLIAKLSKKEQVSKK